MAPLRVLVTSSCDARSSMRVGRYFSTQSCVRPLMVAAVASTACSIGGFWSLARFLALRARARRKLKRALVIYGLFGLRELAPDVVSIAGR
mmetsp:Transcript_18186/g.51830  ORF Transcript_18186/g.51830 Transcript_18186/m.51830 type:complete len:91 (-) Transcript_18186:10-282(-)